MKSAYELALERTGGKLNIVSDEVKKKLSEIENIKKAKIAEAEIFANQKIQSLQDELEIEKVKAALVVDIASITDKYEREKENVRRSSK